MRLAHTGSRWRLITSFVAMLGLLTLGACADDEGPDLREDAAIEPDPQDAARDATSPTDAADVADGRAGDSMVTRDDPDGGAADAAQPTGEPAVRFIGRTDTVGDATRFAWSGSGLHFRFSGTAATVRMDDSAGYFTFLLDGVQQPELVTTPGERDYELAKDLGAGVHEIALYRRPEALFGPTRVLGVTLPGGELLAPPAPRAHRIELIGDSISAGYGNAGGSATCPFEARTEDHWLSYGAITARALDAELITVAWSGKGIVFNYGDDTNDPLPALYARTIPTEAQSTWDFSKWQPELVVINLGTNDFSTDNDPSQQQFVDAYDSLLGQVRDNYPNAWIMCLVPTLLGGTDLGTAQAYVEQVVQELNDAGDTRIVARALSFDSQGFGCDYHPSLATHASMATALTAEIEALTGW